MSNTHQVCENCRFFGGAGADDYGACLRYPPQVVANDGGYQIDSRIPTVHKTSRCGEWRSILANGNISAYDEEFTQD